MSPGPFSASLRRSVFSGSPPEARLVAGLTQVEVAKNLRRPQRYVSKCESGERRVDEPGRRHNRSSTPSFSNSSYLSPCAHIPT